MFFYVYVLQSRIVNRLYMGSTDNLVRRVKEHNLGLNQSTKPYKPWALVYYEACLNETDAKRRERYLKTSQGGRLIRSRLKEYFYHRRFA
jgi:putative endonuclease